MVAMPLHLRGCLLVEEEAVWRLVVAPHATSDIIALANVIAETSAFAINDDSTLTAQSLSSKELG